jgi:hypothetical protein
MINCRLLVDRHSFVDAFTEISATRISGTRTYDDGNISTALTYVRPFDNRELRFCSTKELAVPLSPLFGDCRVMFVSKVTRQGNFGSLDEIDRICDGDVQAQATPPVRLLRQSGSTFRGWLQNSAGDGGHIHAPIANTECLMRVDGAMMIDRNGRTQLLAPPDQHSDGTTIASGTHVWSGYNGTDCNDWSDASAMNVGAYGDPSSTKLWYVGGTTMCARQNSFLCISEPSFVFQPYKMDIETMNTTIGTTIGTSATSSLPSSIVSNQPTTNSSSNVSSQSTTATTSSTTMTVTSDANASTTTIQMTTTSTTINSERSNSPSSSSLPLILGILGAFLALIIIGIVIFFIVRAGRSNDNNNNNDVEADAAPRQSEYGKIPTDIPDTTYG